MHDYNFFKFTREEILRGIGYVLDQERRDNAKVHDPSLAFVYDLGLQKLASLWLDSNQDINLMLLKHSEEVDQILKAREWYEQVKV